MIDIIIKYSNVTSERENDYRNIAVVVLRVR